MDYSIYTVPTSNILAMVITLVICIALPVGLAVVWKVKSRAKLSACFIGCATFIVFALILEQILHMVVLALTGTLLTENVWFYAVYGGLAAGLFEETGRFLAMRFCMRKSLEKKNAIMYGIGHGGIEAILITGMTYVSNLILTATINSGGLGVMMAAVDEATGELLFAQVSPLWELSASQFLWAGVERISAILLHICLSYLVFKAVQGQKIGFYLLAVGIHFLVDAGTFLLMQKLPIAALEGILLLFVIVFAAVTAIDYRRFGKDQYQQISI